MDGSAKTLTWSIGVMLLMTFALACGLVEQSKSPPAGISQQQATAKKAEPKKDELTKGETKAAKKAVEVEGVISSVGQRTITFQTERKGKVREEVVGVDDKTDIEKGGNKVKLRDLQETDKALINYEPDAYTPAIAIKVTGKGEIKKVGGED
jgi:hypothetical protein